MGEAPRGPSAMVSGAAFAVSGGVLGMATGVLTQLVGVTDGVGGVAVGGTLVGGVLGAAAGWLDARRAQGRPVMVDGRGRRVRRGALSLSLAPLLAAAVGFGVLAVLATVQQASLGVGVAFLLPAGACVAVARSVATQGRLSWAAERAALGHRADAEAVWRGLATARWCTRTGHTHAALNLGLSALLTGDLAGAERWYARVRRGRAAAFAAAGLALVYVQRGAWRQAEASLLAASAGGKALQAEVDGARLWLVLERDGPVAAVALGARLREPGAGTVFLAVWALSHLRAGQSASALGLLSDGLGEALASSGLGALFPDLVALSWGGDLDDDG